MNKFEYYIDKYRAIHTGKDTMVYIKDGQHRKVSKSAVYGDGRQLVKKVLPYIDRMIKVRSRAITILDYGCGQARHVYDPRYVNNWQFKNFKDQTIFSFFPGMIQSYYCYDPAVPRYSEPPCAGTKFDLVAVPDVLEHIPEESLESIIRSLGQYVRDDGLIVFSISGNVAAAHFNNEDGTVENAHITVKPFKWWNDLIASSVQDRAYVIIYTADEIKQKSSGVSDTRLFFRNSSKFIIQQF